MKHVNFLVERSFVPHLSSLELNYGIMVLVCVIMLVGFVTYGVIQHARLATLDARLTATLSVPTKTQAISAPAVSPTTRILWAPIIHAVARATPISIRIKTLKGGNASGGIMDIEGSGADLSAVAHYAERLKEVPRFHKVLLASSSEVDEGGKKSLGFHIQCWLE